MRHLVPSALLALLVGCLSLFAAEPTRTASLPTTAASKPPASVSVPRLGINLTGPADWNSELPFVDVMRMSRPWVSQQAGKPWGEGPPLDLDEHGNVLRLAPGCTAETLACTIDGGHYPAGDYTLLYDGQGELDAGHAGTIVARAPGRLTVRVNPADGPIYIKLLKTDPADRVRNIRLVMPGHAETYRDEPFHPLFLERWRGVTCIRFMGWMEINGSKTAHWSERPTALDATFSERGVSLELMVDLCNRLNCDAWFCTPHKADDDYVRRFALYVKEHLRPGLKSYVEYSNEVWNPQFSQWRYANEQGQALGLAENPKEAGRRFTALRSLQIFDLWEAALGGRERLVRVLPTQEANPWATELIVGFRDAGHHADVLAVAPYIGLFVGPNEKTLPSAKVRAWPPERLLDELQNVSLPEEIASIRKQQQIARRLGLKLVAYEGGQHIVGVDGGERDPALTQLFIAANAHPRMADVYRQYLDAWTKEGGDLFCHFSSVSQWGKSGSWGAMRYYDDGLEKSPKYKSLMEWAKSRGQTPATATTLQSSEPR
ncbi:MAG: hypothetical protein NTW19_10180 [Planctomycetota bacterium]|nr:hypothetical protein [Planctomycetota bacterium]